MSNYKGSSSKEKLRDELDAERIRSQLIAKKNQLLAEKLKEKEKSLKKAVQERNRAKRQLRSIRHSRVWRFAMYLRKGYVFALRILGKQIRDETMETIEAESKISSASSNQDKTNLTATPVDENKLKAQYLEKELDKIPDTFILYRIIGNDLYPRHKKGQSRENLRFILENEKQLDGCEKRFVVNRIMDKTEEETIISLLEEHGYDYIHIPFRDEEYRAIYFDTDCYPQAAYLATEEFENLMLYEQDKALRAAYRLKNNYVMNNNGARNAALRDGKKRAKWVLPWDGNCFITPSAWERIHQDVTEKPYFKYFTVPMTRVLKNEDLLNDDFNPDPVEEPQLIFRADSSEEFNEEFSYGRRPKVELFWRLGIPGLWDQWSDDIWDQARRELSPEAFQFGVAGWVARLFSGMGNLEQGTEQSFKERGRVRADSIIATLRSVDVHLADASSKNLHNFHHAVLERERQEYNTGINKSLVYLVDNLIADAEEALTRGLYSVIDKTTLPPSGDAKDYWHPAPYWWPNPKSPDGLPYIRKDGERVPGTRMYEPASDKYDRTRLQRVFDDSTILALAWYFTTDTKYVDHGLKILERFFINPETRMNPHLKYAQVRMGHNDNSGYNHGIIELKDFYYYLDAIRLFDSSGVAKKARLVYFEDWLTNYLEWLLESEQGKAERKSKNNHGIYYDLQVASIASFLNEQSVLFKSLIRAQSRIPQHFNPDGSQPEELSRTNTAHYCCFNFQGWLNISELASRWGVDFWGYEAQNGASLVKGAQWLLSHISKPWPFEQIEAFDYERFLPLYYYVPRENIELPAIASLPESKYGVKAKFHPHDGIKPYWNLGGKSDVNT